jgi:hypothetical protein
MLQDCVIHSRALTLKADFPAPESNFAIKYLKYVDVAELLTLVSPSSLEHG